MDSESIAQGKKNMDCENLAAGGIHFVLVHGAMHGAWCWYKIVELLEKDGHKVSAIDLMSAGTNPVAADSIKSFEEYNQPLMHFLAKLPRTEKIEPDRYNLEKIEYNFDNGIREPPTSGLVPRKFQKHYFYGTTSTLIVLVGHSMGGVSLARGSEDFPHLIAVAVYVCALMFRGGESMKLENEIVNEIIKPNKHILEKIEYNFGNGIGEPPTSALVLKKFQKDYFYSTTSTLDATLASLLLRPLPIMAVMNMSVETTEKRYGVVPRVYVKTTKDNVRYLAKQEELIASSPPQKVYSLDSDHSPFFSEPEKLHNLLLEIVDTYCL